MAAATRFWIVNSSSISSPRAADGRSAGSSWSRRSSAFAAIRSGETAREGGAAASELMFPLYRRARRRRFWFVKQKQTDWGRCVTRNAYTLAGSTRACCRRPRSPEPKPAHYPAMARKPDVDAVALAALVRRAFGTSVPVRCERTPEGISTQVYRLVRGQETFYLRVAEEADENLETDAELHRRLLTLGVRVPRVVFVEPFDATIGRSVAITTEMPGASLAAAAPRPAMARAVAEAAGEDLAVINRVAVDGFGWVRRRGPGWPLRAEHASYLTFLTSYLPASWPGPLPSLLSGGVVAAGGAVLDAERARAPATARLAHGDLDRKSTRLNSSHGYISYAVFCLKKKK